ncbi:MAG: 1-acyl-sn-glycerol-3-phosphate acyltransferase [Chloroflexi bacterium]|nr:1-acyl-sn-glycerol-3-phosphate acyltransferase [Chloroflexota bacterium]
MNQLDTLTQINLDDLVSSFGWQERPVLSRLLRGLFRSPARAFARQMADFDSAVGASGLVEAARGLQRSYAREVQVFGTENIPPGAFLALSNHPGMTDTLALFIALNRPDLKIIALDRPFLNALPEMSKQLFYVRDDPAARMGLVRQVSAHLKNGGAALTFPAGHIEPDPDVYPGALESLKDWTDSVGVFIRMAPQTAVVPVLVRSVVMPSAARHWLLRIKQTKDEKEKLAAALQLLAHVAFGQNDVHVRVQIGRPVTVKALGTTDTQAIHQAVLAEMKHLTENPPNGEGLPMLWQGTIGA